MTLAMFIGVSSIRPCPWLPRATAPNQSRFLSQYVLPGARELVSERRAAESTANDHCVVRHCPF
jgi:hypothetical protein